MGPSESGRAAGTELTLEGVTLDDRYSVSATLGAGGMATVYLATDTRLDRSVVVKMPHTALAAQPDFLARFQREIASLTKIEHPHVVKVHDTGTFGGLPYAVLQHLSGGSLKDRLDKAGGKLPPAEILPWLLQVADALDHIHARGMVHRDVKPGNILYDDAGNVVLADFGIAKAMGHLDTGITTTGVTPGSPGYMAPEVVKGGELGPGYDQFSLAVCVYEALAGRLPHEGTTPLELLTNLIHKSAADLAPLAPGIQSDAVSAVMKALSRDPSKRFATCTEFAKAFQQALGVSTRMVFPTQFAAAMRRRRWLRVGVAAGLLAAAAAIGWFARPGAPESVPGAPPKEPTSEAAAPPPKRDLGEPPWKLVTPPDGPSWAKVSEVQVAEARKLGVPVAFENSIGMRFVLIPSGKFTMGSPPDEPGRDPDEVPRDVTISRAFYLGVHEVTNAQFRSWDPAHRTRPPEASGVDGDEQPAATITNSRARAFVEFLAWKEARGYRLPTDEEWEYACRAGTTGPTFWGDSPAEVVRYANFGDRRAGLRRPTWGVDDVDDGFAVAAPCGSFLPNPWGLHDMLGNASEWVDATGDGRFRTDRGGSWANSGYLRRIAARRREVVGARVTMGGGFRVAVDIDLPVQVAAPAESATLDEGLVSVRGTASGATTVRVNGVTADVRDGRFDVAITLPPGEQEIEVVAGALSTIRRVKVAAVPRPEAGWPGVPAWAKVSKQQIDEAKRLGVDVAFENSLGMRFVLVPAGRFLMGSPESEPSRRANEAQHWVTLTRPFYVQTTEVTNAQYRRRDATHSSAHAAGSAPEVTLDDDEQPVVRLRDNDCFQFANWLGERDPGRAYRLPTEAEWEYAARAGTQGRYHWASEDAATVGRYANVGDRTTKAQIPEASPIWFKDVDDGFAATAPVARFAPNPWGLHDVLGNVTERCSDFGPAEPCREAVVDPRGPATGETRILRAGAWWSAPGETRIALRHSPADEPYQDCGFRLAADLPAAK